MAFGQLREQLREELGGNGRIGQNRVFRDLMNAKYLENLRSRTSFNSDFAPSHF